MFWEWGAIVCAVSALIGLLLAVIYVSFEIAGQSPPIDPQKTGLTRNPATLHKLVAPTDQVEKRLAVIHSSAQFLLENLETEEVKRTVCRFIMEEADNLAASIHRS